MVHHVDMTISVSGSNILQGFREVPATCPESTTLSLARAVCVCVQALGGSGAVPEEEGDDVVKQLCKSLPAHVPRQVWLSGVPAPPPPQPSRAVT